MTRQPAALGGVAVVLFGLVTPLAYGQHAGWRPVVRRAAAQSPDEPAPLPARRWTYPVPSRSRTVPVPRYRSNTVPSLGDSSRLNAPTSQRLNESVAPPIAAAAWQNSTPATDAYPSDPFGADACPPDPCADLVAPWAPRPCTYSWSNAHAFALVDGFHQSGDSDRWGGRFGFNWTLPVTPDESGFGVQAGFAGSPAEEGAQLFGTAGAFWRGDSRIGPAWNLGGVVDWMHDNDFDSDVAQVRAAVSNTVSLHSEIGVWGTLPVVDDEQRRAGRDRDIEPVGRANIFYRHLFRAGWDATAWVGWRSDPSDGSVGGDLRIPLTDSWSFAAGGHWGLDDETWNVFGGVTYHFGHQARQRYLGEFRHQPYLPVADNTRLTLRAGM